MADFTNPVDSPTEWVAGHIKKYVETDGEANAVTHELTLLTLHEMRRRQMNERHFYGWDNSTTDRPEIL